MTSYEVAVEVVVNVHMDEFEDGSPYHLYSDVVSSRVVAPDNTPTAVLAAVERQLPRLNFNF